MTLNDDERDEAQCDFLTWWMGQEFPSVGYEAALAVWIMKAEEVKKAGEDNATEEEFENDRRSFWEKKDDDSFKKSSGMWDENHRTAEQNLLEALMRAGEEGMKMHEAETARQLSDADKKIGFGDHRRDEFGRFTGKAGKPQELEIDADWLSKAAKLDKKMHALYDGGSKKKPRKKAKK